MYKAIVDNKDTSKIYYENDLCALKRNVYQDLSKEHFYSIIYEDADGYFDHEDIYVDVLGNIEEC